MFEKLQAGEKSMMHQDSLKPAAVVEEALA